MTADPHPHYPADAAHEAADPATPPDRLEVLSLDPQLEPIVAANPSASASTLERLRSAQHPATRAAVAGNPNTPLKALWQVAAEFPQEFLDNPVLPLLLLERPNLGTELPLETVQGLLRCEQVPAALFKPLANHRSLQVQELVSMHVSIAGEPRRGKHRVPDKALRVALSPALSQADWMFALPGLFPAWLLELAADHVHTDAIATCPDAPVALLERLAASESPDKAARAARNPRTPIEALDRLSRQEPVQVRIAVTEHPRVPDWLLKRLAADQEYQVRRAVARNSHTPASTLQLLANDPDVGVRAWAARHPRMDVQALEQLACDDVPSVRAGAARNPHTPSPWLEVLASDTDPDVRAAAARNPQLPPGWLERLLRDDDPTVRRVAARRARPEALEPLLDPQRGDVALLEGAAENDRLSGALVARLGQGISFPILRRLAQHPHAPADLLQRLAGHPDAWVRAAVARNSRTPLATLEQLASDGEQSVRFALAYNPRTPFAVLEQLCAEADGHLPHAIVHHQSVSHVARRRIYARFCERARPGNAGQATLVRLAALSGNFLSPEDYWAGVRSTRWIERYVLARNPSAPLDVLEVLAHDGIVCVRAAASDSLAARRSVRGPGAPRFGIADLLQRWNRSSV